jgi:hypothetical protein
VQATSSSRGGCSARQRRNGRRGGREGYAFRFAPDAFADVARFVANERKCCPFLDFEIAAESAGPVWLRLTGPAGTRAFLEAELGIPAG